jgi:hypothetical protein
MRRIALSSVARPALPHFSTLSLKFHENPSSKRFVVHKVALGQVFLRVLPFRPVIVIPQLLDTHLHLHAALTSGQTLFRKSRNIR